MSVNDPHSFTPWREPGVWVCFAMMIALRVAVFSRDPDVDELFTIWISRKEIGPMFASLRLDSGPPLFYLFLHAIGNLLPLSVSLIRSFSLVAGAGAFFAAVSQAESRAAAVAISTLIALHPLHIYFSTLGRAYALAAFTAGSAAILLVRWAGSGNRSLLVAGAAAISLTAYIHYYGIYLFPLPFVLGLTLRDRKRLRDGAVACGAIALSFLPGFLLMRLQPSAALSWMRINDDLSRVVLVLGSFGRFGFDGRQALPMLWLAAGVQLMGLALLVLALVRALKVPLAMHYLITIITPVMAAVIAAVLGFSAYFPLRFESVFVVPFTLFFVLAIGSLDRKKFFIAALTSALTAGVASSFLVTSAGKNLTDDHQAALAIRRQVAADVHILTSGPVYFEIDAQRSASWPVSLRVFPSASEIHPGRTATESDLLADLPLLRALNGGFIWVGDPRSMEARFLRRHFYGTLHATFGQTVVILVREERSANSAR